MNLAGWVRYRALLATQRPRRYVNLFRAAYESRARGIVEVGTWNGVHARQLIDVAAIHHPRSAIRYFGFDLFEAQTDADLAREFSKRPPAMAEVQRALAASGAAIRLFAGDTHDSLPAAAAELTNIDLAFIDGGHAEETIASDWRAIARVMGPRTVVLFDDYYVDPAPALRGLGCQGLVDGLDRSAYHVTVHDPVDVFPQPWGELRIRIAEVRRR